MIDMPNEIPTGVLLLDGEGTIVKLNLFGEYGDEIPGERYIHRSIFDVLKKGSNRLAEQIRERFVKKGAFRIPSFKIEESYLSFEFRPLCSGGGILIIRDVTEVAILQERLKEYSEQLEKKVEERTRELAAANKELQAQQKELIRANVKLKELDRLKSEFLATMSHELRTPLNSIIGFTGIILQGISGEINEEQRKQLSMVYKSAKHLLALINGILDLSRIESGKMEILLERFKIQDVVSEVAQGLSPMISEKGLELIIDIPDEIPEIYSDRKKVSQIFLNLVNNAVKFTEAGEIRIECRLDNDNLEISVSDTGIGIRKENMEYLFQTFRQINGTVRRRYEGAGLGLYLCHKLVTLLGGRLWAESEYGKGSRFTFTLPIGFEEKRGGIWKKG